MVQLLFYLFGNLNKICFNITEFTMHNHCCWCVEGIILLVWMIFKKRRFITFFKWNLGLKRSLGVHLWLKTILIFALIFISQWWFLHAWLDKLVFVATIIFLELIRVFLFFKRLRLDLGYIITKESWMFFIFFLFFLRML